ncbi:MAG: hypothetical protein WCH10_04105 [bacterium]
MIRELCKAEVEAVNGGENKIMRNYYSGALATSIIYAIGCSIIERKTIEDTLLLVAFNAVIAVLATGIVHATIYLSGHGAMFTDPK